MEKEQVTDLMDSIYNDYPIGSVLLWEVNEKLPALRNLANYKLPDKTEEFLILYFRRTTKNYINFRSI